LLLGDNDLLGLDFLFTGPDLKIGWREDDSDIFNACFIIEWESGMRPEMSKAKNCQKSGGCQMPPPPPKEFESKTITSCEDLPGYELLIESKGGL
jgi:hypothetical protein